MNELPDLPFQQVLTYLSLVDCLKSRAVSRDWKARIDNYRVKSLCCSERASGFVRGKHRLISGEFAQNFISSSRFGSFYSTFGQSVLSNLKRLRLCDLQVQKKNRKAFIECLQSFGKLEELDIIRFRILSNPFFSSSDLELRFPVLTSINIERSLPSIGSLTLDAPRLRKVRVSGCLRRILLVHPESVEKVIIDRFDQIDVQKLKNLKQLYVESPSYFELAPTLSGLEQLSEIHLDKCSDVPYLLEQKRQYGLADLKIYLSGALQNDEQNDEQAAHIGVLFICSHQISFAYLVENHTKLADEIAFLRDLRYSAIERVAPEVAISILKRLTNLETIRVDEPINDIARFLDLVKTLQIAELEFECAQPQDLFDRLPEHCTLQFLVIHRTPGDLDFLFRLQHLVHFKMLSTVDTETIRRFFEELQFAWSVEFLCASKRILIQTYEFGKRFGVSIDGSSSPSLPDLNAVIEYIENKLQKVVCKNEAAVHSVQLL